MGVIPGRRERRAEAAQRTRPIALSRGVRSFRARRREARSQRWSYGRLRLEFDGLFGLESLFGLDLGSSNMLTGVFAQQQEIGRLFNRTDLYYLGFGLAQSQRRQAYRCR